MALTQSDKIFGNCYMHIISENQVPKSCAISRCYRNLRFCTGSTLIFGFLRVSGEFKVGLGPIQNEWSLIPAKKSTAEVFFLNRLKSKAFLFRSPGFLFRALPI